MSTRLTISQPRTSARSSTPGRSRLLQRKCSCGGTPGPTGECEECHKKRLQRQIGNTETDNRHNSLVPPIVHEVLRSPGQPLDPATLAFMEPRFGHDLGQVRLHADTKAQDSARAVSALAYTVGQDIIFGAGQYSPHSEQGNQLMAHELTHVLQQTALSGSSGSLDHAEAEADRNARYLTSMRPTLVQSGVEHGVIQRQQEFSEQPEEVQAAQALQGSWQEYYDVALQGTSGIRGLKPAEIAELTGKIADEALQFTGNKVLRERAEGGTPNADWQDWKSHFKSALQTTAQDAFNRRKPVKAVKDAVKKASDIADAAVAVSRQARPRLERLFKPKTLSEPRS